MPLRLLGNILKDLFYFISFIIFTEGGCEMLNVCIYHFKIALSFMSLFTVAFFRVANHQMATPALTGAEGHIRPT